MFPNVKVIGATPALRCGVLQLTHTLLRLQKAPSTVSLDVSFVGIDEMHQINLQSRGIDAPTDVLTFSQSSKEETLVNELLFSSFSGEEDNDGDGLHVPDSAMREELLSLGSVYVSVEYMWRRSQMRPTQNLPLIPYLSAALVHAELHALGYDHTTPEELREMVKREQFIGWQLHSQARRAPWTLQALDPFEYLKIRRAHPRAC